MKRQQRGVYCRDKRLSVEAKGTLAFLLSHPKGFKFSIEYIKGELGMGWDKTKRILRELKQYEYLILIPKRSSSGQFTGQSWSVFHQGKTND